MNFPDFFKVKTGAQSQLTHIPMAHHHLTTTDFFKIQPLCARYVVPKDKMNIDVTSFVRFFPMPFPVFGRIKYYNRAFFVPFRQIAEGWNQFIDDVDYPDTNGFIRIQSAPYFTNKDICDAFYATYSDPSTTYPLLETISSSYYYWRKYNENISYLVDCLGKLVTFDYSGIIIAFYKDQDGNIYICDNTTSQYINGSSAFGFADYGSFSSSVASGVTTCTITDSVNTGTYKFVYGTGNPSVGTFQVASNVTLPPFSAIPYDKVKYDFLFGTTPYRFTNRGRYFYTLLCSLGYRVSWVNANGSFQSQKKLNAGKLLAFVKIYLDWYAPSAYSDVNDLRMLFRGVASSGRHITYQELVKISQNIEFACYDRDYFTSAWQNPTGPNVSPSDVLISDSTVINVVGNNYNYRSEVRNSQLASGPGSTNRTPTLNGVSTGSSGTDSRNHGAFNISYYILEQLRALTNWARRNQLSGNKPVDRHLANFGVKLNDDRVDRCYYIGGYSYDADIMDIMSTADTDKAVLGDYAGKGIAYSDAHRSFHFESDEHGYIIVVSSVVPEVGYVQGIMRENLDLTRFELSIGDFDNLGTQAQRNDELFADYGMPTPDGSEVIPVLPEDGVRGFVPRYAHLKCGADFLTGDFNVPSRREGLDAFHLFRLFNNPNIPSINKDFLIGEQQQYDRIFNNVDSDYDHMYVVHSIMINAQRPMKSISEVYDFEHSDGRELEIAADGTQLN